LIFCPSSETAPAVGLSRSPIRFEQRALSATRRPHDGDELAGGDVEVDVVKRQGLHALGSVDFIDIF